MGAVKRYEIDMINGPLVGKIIRFALPIMAANLIQLLFNAADLVVVGQYDSGAAQTAVTSTTALVNLVVNLLLGFGVGVNVMVAQAIGSGERSRISTVVHTAIASSILMGGIMAVLSIWVTPNMLDMMGTLKEVFDLAVLYLRIYFLGLPGELLYTFGSALLRSQGDTKRPMYYLTFAGLVNVLLNLLFVVVFKWSVAGVAVATVASKWLSALLVLHCLVNETGSVHLDLKKLKIHWPTLGNIVRIGVPAGVQSSLFSLSNLSIQSAVNSMGQSMGMAVVEGGGAAASINTMLHTSTSAFYNASLTFSSQNFGAGKPKRVDKVLWNCLWMSVLASIVLGGGSVLFGRQLLGIYINNNPEAINQGMIRMITTSGFIFLNAVNNMPAGALRGLGYTVMPLVITLIGTCVLRIIWVETIFPLYPTPWGLYICYPITWAATGFVMLAYYYIVRPKMYAKAREKQTEQA